MRRLPVNNDFYVGVHMHDEVISVERHFHGKELPAKLYAAIVAFLTNLGGISEEPKKTSIHLVRRVAVAGVEVRRGCILLNIKNDYPIENPRIIRREQLSANRYHHKLRLSNMNEIDDELKVWLSDAYRIS